MAPIDCKCWLLSSLRYIARNNDKFIIFLSLEVKLLLFLLLLLSSFSPSLSFAMPLILLSTSFNPGTVSATCNNNDNILFLISGLIYSRLDVSTPFSMSWTIFKVLSSGNLKFSKAWPQIKSSMTAIDGLAKAS